MFKKRPRKEGAYILKQFLRRDLLDPWQSIEKRVAQINSLDFESFYSLVKTRLSFQPDCVLEYRQKFIDRERHQTSERKPFEELAEALQYLHSIGFVHGDINFKNILYAKGRYHLVDFEPSFYRRKLGYRMLMATRPYITHGDLAEGNLTSLTDKLGFTYFVLRSRNKFGPKERYRLTQTLAHEAFLGLKEGDIASLSYPALLQWAW